MRFKRCIIVCTLNAFLAVKLDHCVLEYIAFILYNVLPNAHTLSIYLAGLFILIDEQNRCIHTVYISGVTYSLERAVIVLCACLPACICIPCPFLETIFFSMEIDVLLWSWLSWMHRKSLWFAMLKNRRWKIKWKIYSYYSQVHKLTLIVCAWVQNAWIYIFASLFVRSYKLVSYLISFSLFLFKQFIAFFNDVSVDGLLSFFSSI